jgi:preprotein translocase subunit YajC
MFESPAYAAAGGAAAPGGGVGLFLAQIFPFLLIFIIFYLLVIRPQQRRVKQHQEMIAAVKRNDTVVTTGGLIGKVTRVDEAEIEVELAANVRVRVVKGMLSEVRPVAGKAANDQPAGVPERKGFSKGRGRRDAAASEPSDLGATDLTKPSDQPRAND